MQIHWQYHFLSSSFFPNIPGGKLIPLGILLPIACNCCKNAWRCYGGSIWGFIMLIPWGRPPILPRPAIVPKPPIPLIPLILLIPPIPGMPLIAPITCGACPPWVVCCPWFCPCWLIPICWSISGVSIIPLGIPIDPKAGGWIELGVVFWPLILSVYFCWGLKVDWVCWPVPGDRKEGSMLICWGFWELTCSAIWAL